MKLITIILQNFVESLIVGIKNSKETVCIGNLSLILKASCGLLITHLVINKGKIIVERPAHLMKIVGWLQGLWPINLYLTAGERKLAGAERLTVTKSYISVKKMVNSD